MNKQSVLLFILVYNFVPNLLGQDIKIIDYKEFQIKNSSIRAIEVVNSSTLWFAGSNGKYGKIVNNLIEIDSITNLKKENIHFRSIAFNGSEVFMLSIENPAILLKFNAFETAINSYKVVYEEISDKVFYDSMKFFDKKNGIAMGDPTEECLSVIITQDGGNSWKKISCENLPKSFEGEAAFAASNTNIAVIKNNVWIATGGKKSRIFKSTNRGKNWMVYNTPIVQGGKMTGIFTVDFYDKNNGIVMGGNWEDKSYKKNTKAITKDGGVTWNLVAENELPGYISCVQYIPKTNGNQLIAVSTEGIFYSNNKGKNWKSISDKSFYSIRFTDKYNAWLSANNKIAKIKFNYN